MYIYSIDSLRVSVLIKRRVKSSLRSLRSLANSFRKCSPSAPLVLQKNVKPIPLNSRQCRKMAQAGKIQKLFCTSLIRIGHSDGSRDYCEMSRRGKV